VVRPEAYRERTAWMATYMAGLFLLGQSARFSCRLGTALVATYLALRFFFFL